MITTYPKKRDQLEDPDQAAGAVLQQLVKKYIFVYFLINPPERKTRLFPPERKTLLDARRGKNFQHEYIDPSMFQTFRPWNEGIEFRGYC
ncbi:hypothetical protein ES702_01748 [subsurface metagenome]